MKEKFLPIGTVLLLKGGKKEVMITSYCIFPTKVQKPNGDAVNDGPKMYEYGGCVYPEGILNSNMACAFNHDQIEKIIYLGYESEEQKELSKILNAGYENYKSKYENNSATTIQNSQQENNKAE